MIILVGGIKIMWRKRMATAAAAGILAATLMSFPAFAHGHGHHRSAASVDTSCPVCTVEGCTETGRHVHDDHYYCGYEHSSGYCDGSCAAASQSDSYCGRGHGCHR